ncbi:MAG: SDR family oxidoreductase [Rhodospirillales bacterium]|nr:SDR family oxidoreductase [Rhodospirillales bacterium]
MESENPQSKTPLILLTGATGYVGGRLLRSLIQDPWRVRCLARRPEMLKELEGPEIEVIQGNIFEIESLQRAMRGVDIAYYLIHSLGSSKSFEEEERRGAENFAHAAREASLKRIIFLGGLGSADRELSPHLRSRQEVGRILRTSGVPTIELRASIIIGSGSLSFEMIRALVDRLPVMITPRWVRVPAQPIQINDVLAYLIEAMRLPLPQSRIYEIGGCDQVAYRHIMAEYARQRGLHRMMISVPVLTPRLSSLWLGLVTPIYARIGRKLIDGIRFPTVVRDDSALRDFDIQPCNLEQSINLALRNEDKEYAATRWSDALSSGGNNKSWGGIHFGKRIIDSRSIHVPVSAARAFTPIRRIGGSGGWYYANWLWRLRGFIDLLIGGVGLRRGRRHPERLNVGDTVDCWRVESIEPNSLLRLGAEMKLPGRAWLQFEVDQEGAGSIIRQTAIFDPLGLGGLIYWYALYPVHRLIFAGMLREIARRSQHEVQI